MFLGNSLRNLNRLREVIGVLLKYGFEDIVARSSLRFLVPNRNKWLRDEKPVLEYSRFERMRMVVEELGSTFIKLAQLLSNRPDVLPEGLIDEFAKLQDGVPPVNFKTIKATFELETGKKIEEWFSFFDKKAIGSASIGQVHRAILHNGTEVVVKIQRPNVEKQIKRDLSLIREFVRLTNSYFKNIGILNALEIVDTFEKTMEQELDFVTEIRNLEQFKRIYAQNNDFYVPLPYPQYSTNRILTMEYISGCKITDIPQLEAWGLSAERIVEKGMEIYLMQIFEKGFFHADPHPGNILVRPDGTIVLIDFGMVGKLLKSQRFAFAGIFVALANQDARTMAINLRKLATDSELENSQGFENDLGELVETIFGLDIDQANIAVFTESLQKIIYKYKLQVPGTVFLILRALAILEGIGQTLHPNFQTLDFVKPYGLKLLAEQFSFQNQRNELVYSISQVFSLLYIFPSEVKYILKQVRNGNLNLNYTIKDFESLPTQIKQGTQRISQFLLISMLILSGTIFLLSPLATKMPLYLGLPWLSTYFYLIAFGLYIFWNFKFWWKKDKK
jgi:ubiquinone biosynthesis protein